MKTFNLLAFLFIAVFFSSCDKEKNRNPLDFQLGQSFDLAFENTADCTCGELSVTFADVVEDSRCPIGAVCVWEGQARVQLQVKSPEGSQSVELIYQALRSSFDRDTIGNFAVSLLDVSPHPREGQTIDKRDYRIRLMVEELP